MMKHTLAKIIATTFGAGFWPWGPGTAGAAVGVLLWVPLWLWTDSFTLFITTAALTLIFTALGIWSGTEMEKQWGPDPSKVVMDETVGVWINLLPVTAWGTPTGQWWWIAGAFVLFRLLDILKPFGIRKLEKLGGGLGIMADDIAAGMLGALILLAIQWITLTIL